MTCDTTAEIISIKGIECAHNLVGSVHSSGCVVNAMAAF